MFSEQKSSEICFDVAHVTGAMRTSSVNTDKMPVLLGVNLSQKRRVTQCLFFCNLRFANNPANANGLLMKIWNHLPNPPTHISPVLI